MFFILCIFSYQPYAFSNLFAAEVTNEAISDLKVIPGGQTIGVKVKSDGILVVGHHFIPTGKNVKVSPAQASDVTIS